MSRDLPRAPFRTPDVPCNGVIPTRDPTFGLPFDITRIVRGGAGDGGRIAEFEHHLAKEDASGEHVGHLRSGTKHARRRVRQIVYIGDAMFVCLPSKYTPRLQAYPTTSPGSLPP